MAPVGEEDTIRPKGVSFEDAGGGVGGECVLSVSQGLSM